MIVITGIFYLLHGFVHMLYMGHSLNYFELEKEFTWPENSRIFKSIFSLKSKKQIAAALCLIAALGFILSGIFVLTGSSKVNLTILVAVLSSTVLYITFWDGSTRKMHTQGAIAIAINMLILVYELLL